MQCKPFKEEGDYSYAMKQIVGDRTLLIGDAAPSWIRFLDRSQHRSELLALRS